MMNQKAYKLACVAKNKVANATSTKGSDYKCLSVDIHTVSTPLFERTRKATDLKLVADVKLQCGNGSIIVRLPVDKDHSYYGGVGSELYGISRCGEFTEMGLGDAITIAKSK